MGSLNRGLIFSRRNQSIKGQSLKVSVTDVSVTDAMYQRLIYQSLEIQSLKACFFAVLQWSSILVSLRLFNFIMKNSVYCLKLRFDLYVNSTLEQYEQI